MTKVPSLRKRSGDAESTVKGGSDNGTGAGDEGDSGSEADQGTKGT